MIVTRPYGDLARFQAAATHLLSSLDTGTHEPDSLPLVRRERDPQK